jgi:hypothetical protein
LEATDEEFVFLFIFDFHSRAERKNPLTLINAFKEAFAPTDLVRLVIKCVNGHSDSGSLSQMRALSSGYPISIYDGYWTSSQMRDLMEACDAYISLHRSEGIGLTITDAMACGKPVIATGWSGNMDFMNVSNSYPVRYELVEIEKNAGQYRAGEIWAEPSAEHAAELMRHLFENREEAQGRGLVANKDIETHYSEECIARLIDQRFTVIGAQDRFCDLKHKVLEPIRDLDSFLEDFKDLGGYVPSDFLLYHRLLGDIRSIARRAIPAAATTVVVSKGDDELLKLGTQRVWHFPQTEAGVYAGHYPAHSLAAVEHLEALRSKGANYLLFPSTAFWWLEHYAEFGRHLDVNYRRVWDDQYCRIYHLISPLNGTPVEEIEGFQILTNRLQDLSKNEMVLRAKLLETHDQQFRRDDQITGAIGKLDAKLMTFIQQAEQEREAKAQQPPQNGNPASTQPLDYQHLIDRIRQTVQRAVPKKATIIVVSRGDHELLRLDVENGGRLAWLTLSGRKAWHFPRTETGVYAGHYPTDSLAAIEHLESLRSKGGKYLLFPNTAFWWLEHYAEFARHLDINYRRVWDDQHCRIYHLN